MSTICKGMIPICGLAGFNLSPDESVDARALSVALLLDIEKRGTHATGAAFFEDGKPFVQKTDMRASEFVEYLDMAPTVTNAILHTRFGTHGSPKVNKNNHPIDLPGIIGVHNGVVENYRELFNRIGMDKRLTEVDSEAIFASLLHEREKPVYTLARVRGSAAVAWFETYGDPDVLHAARISSSPFVFGYTESGSFVFASTEEALVRGLGAVGLSLSGGPYTLEEGVYLRVRNGDMVSRMTFETARRGALTATEKRALNLV